MEMLVKMLVDMLMEMLVELGDGDAGRNAGGYADGDALPSILAANDEVILALTNLPVVSDTP